MELEIHGSPLYQTRERWWTEGDGSEVVGSAIGWGSSHPVGRRICGLVKLGNLLIFVVAWMFSTCCKLVL